MQQKGIQSAFLTFSTSRLNVTSKTKGGTRFDLVEKIKVLGWHFSSKPTAAAYIKVLKRRFHERY